MNAKEARYYVRIVEKFIFTSPHENERLAKHVRRTERNLRDQHKLLVT